MGLDDPAHAGLFAFCSSDIRRYASNFLYILEARNIHSWNSLDMLSCPRTRVDCTNNYVEKIKSIGTYPLKIQYVLYLSHPAQRLVPLSLEFSFADRRVNITVSSTLLIPGYYNHGRDANGNHIQTRCLHYTKLRHLRSALRELQAFED